MDCISVCPNDALYFGFGKPAVGVSKTISKNYSLTWPEEIMAGAVFYLSFMAVWDVYQLVPMLMALGIACVTTYLAVRSWRLFRANDLAFYRYALKSSGTIRKAGWVFLLFSFIWIGLNAHSGWVRYHERAGARAFESLQIPDELALSGNNPSSWLSSSDRANVLSGKEHFRTARNGGLFTNSEALSKLAWMEYLSGDTERSLATLDAATKYQEGEPRALSFYYKGAILNRAGQYDQALASLEQALNLRPDLIVAREEMGESLWQLGRRKEAVSKWSDALELNPDLVLANYQLAGAAAVAGDAEAASDYESRGDKLTAADPYFHWMLGLRLQNIGMNTLAEKHFQKAIQLDSSFITRRDRRPRQQ
jgi:tetratricopeptide (TPR) repeat protein